MQTRRCHHRHTEPESTFLIRFSGDSHTHESLRSTILNHPRNARTGCCARSKLKVLKSCQKGRCVSSSPYTGIIISRLCSSCTCRQSSNLPLKEESTHVPPQARRAYSNLCWYFMIRFVFLCQDGVIFPQRAMKFASFIPQRYHCPFLPFSTFF